MEKIKAVLLVGGLGTRLRPLTNDRPKSIVPVLNRPVLEHTLAYLKQYGIRDIIITLNYLPEVIERYFGDGKRFGVHLTYCMETEPRGTAGAVKNAESYLDGSFFVLNGDVFTDMNLNDMLVFHRKKKAKATISMTWVDDVSRYGVIEVDDNSRVIKFLEKPPEGVTDSHWINAGTYILEPEVLAEIPAGCHHMFEKGLFPHLLETDKPVYGYPYKGYWLDMGNPGHYHAINMDLLNGKAHSPLYKSNGTKSSYDKKQVRIHPSAAIRAPVIIGNGSTIGQGVQINGPAILGSDCRLNDGAIIENTVLWDGVTIGANSQITGCIISSNTIITENQRIENSVIAPSQAAPLVFSKMNNQ